MDLVGNEAVVDIAEQFFGNIFFDGDQEEWWSVDVFDALSVAAIRHSRKAEQELGTEILDGRAVCLCHAVMRLVDNDVIDLTRTEDFGCASHRLERGKQHIYMVDVLIGDVVTPVGIIRAKDGFEGFRCLPKDVVLITKEKILLLCSRRNRLVSSAATTVLPRPVAMTTLPFWMFVRRALTGISRHASW